mmetsp:Transcript_55411/g.126743  ORF Transcript_55411/g.126743 Transcript_55411/m.126743 type:complete len:274 (+) Transcript_55411:66-887(+)
MQTGQRPRFHPAGPARLAVLALALSLASCIIALPGAEALIVPAAPSMANGGAHGGTADLASGSACQRSSAMSVQAFKATLAGTKGGLVLDIDETLSWTVAFWVERMQKLFGNPENLSVKDMADKYKLTQNVPYWQTDEAFAWMQKTRESEEAQEELPLVEGALQGVNDLLSNSVPLVGYLTVRPQAVLAPTERWLRAMGFPVLPVVAKPDDVPFQQGNAWKAEALRQLLPEVACIVDDNPSLPEHVGDRYAGRVFLYSHASAAPHLTHHTRSL